MQTPIDRIRQSQVNYDEMRWGSSEGYGDGLVWAMHELAYCIAWAVAASEFCSDEQLDAIGRRTEALLAAGRVIAKAETRLRGPQTWGATDA